MLQAFRELIESAHRPAVAAGETRLFRVGQASGFLRETYFTPELWSVGRASQPGLRVEVRRVRRGYTQFRGYGFYWTATGVAPIPIGPHHVLAD